MGTSSRGPSQSRSRSPRGTTSNNSHTIPEIFRTQRTTMASSPPASNTSQSHTEITLTPTDISNTPLPQPLPSHWQPSLQDLQTVAADIKDTLFSAITDLRHELQAITGRIQRVEDDAVRQSSHVKKIQHNVDHHTMQLRDLQRHVEDLDNRGRRHNLRIRGIPESVEQDRISPVVTGLFNHLLDRPEHTQISMDRIHRALRPKGRESDPPRDIICFINEFAIKEELLQKAREKSILEYNGHPIHIYQDLSAITLRHRKDLRSLLDVLKMRGIRYRWKFPFGLFATHQSRSALLRVPEDLDAFCRTLDIPYTPVPNWYAEFNIQPSDRSPYREEPMDAQNTSFRRRRSPSTNRTTSSPDPRYPPSSPMTAPLPRRARRDR